MTNTFFSILPYWGWPLALAALLGVLRLPVVKGWIGEAWVRLIARLQLPAKTYHRLHNVTLPDGDGTTTQIDHLFISRHGIFVVETKHMKGWIWGHAHEAQWRQQIYRQSRRFQNPLRQNHRHVMVLQAILGLPEQALHSIIVFTGDCTFKTAMPENVTQGAGFVRYIRQFTARPLSERQVREALARIQASRLPPNWKTHRAHVARLQTRHAKKPKTRDRRAQR